MELRCTWRTPTLSKKEKKQIRDLEYPIHSQTANGEISATKYTMIYVEKLDITIEAVIMANSPPVLSLGMLVEEQTFIFMWVPGKAPHLTRNGQKYKCFPTHNVPFITVGMKSETTHAEGEDNSAGGNSQQTSETEIAPKAHKKQEPAGGNSSTDTEKDKVPEVLETSSKAAETNLERVRKTLRKKTQLSDVKMCKHNPFTHFPKDPNCEVCKECKTQRSRCKSCPDGKPDGLPEPKAFADAITADHAILNEEDKSRDNDRAVCVIQDQHTHWLQSHPAPSRSKKRLLKRSSVFWDPRQKPSMHIVITQRSFAKLLVI